MAMLRERPDAVAVSAGAGVTQPAAPPDSGDSSGGFWTTPLRVRAYLFVVALAAIGLPLALTGRGSVDATGREWLTAGMLVVVSVLNVEIGRSLSGGLSRTHQPHKALSAWAFACALLLPPPWLLVVVPLTYAHARWRGIVVPLWKWVGSACYLVLCGLSAALMSHAVHGEGTNFMAANGGRGLLALTAAAVCFLAVEAALFAGTALLNRAEDEVWLRRTLRSPSFYVTEAGVLLIGGLLSAVWTGGAWFVLLCVPIYALAQRAALHEPLRERAESAALLAARNDELELANQFKIDLLGMLGHELGNPLTAIEWYAEIGTQALQADDPKATGDALQVIERNSAEIRRVLREILMMVKSDRGALTAHPESCPLDEHLRAAVSAQPTGRPAVVDCPPGLAADVQPGHLDQILANLLSNAAKYADGATRVVARPAGDGSIELSVVDDGPGIPAEFREHLFERFTRNAQTAQRMIGTGLGLFIARELARANGGDVTHREARPSGSVFVVTLPQAS